MTNFCTSIHCIDGRIQEPIINFLKKHYRVKYIDSVTEAGPCKILSENINTTLVNSIIDRTEISLFQHKSNLIVISGHYDCAVNSTSKETQVKQIKQSMRFLETKYPEIKIVGIWIDEQWEVSHC